ncbi:MAG: 3-methyl-2-oxobutanoate hydroxymethyltransferase [Gemmatimonadota bacterium]|nr:3-methyl-2-oxobutanoate hydroxymethyltransferase [Gemmatimonadota bacterium]
MQTQRAVTVRDIRDRKGKEPLVVVTAYDVLFARIVDQAGVDIVLVGDSLGNVVAGFDTTLSVTLDHMIYHGAAVKRGVTRALVTVDMPFMACQVDEARALENCGRVLAETGAQAVKIEGGSERIAATIARLVEIGIPVMGHLGFTPQSVNAIGVRVQARDAADAERLVEEAVRLEAAGAFAIVLELIPAALASRVTSSVSIPTIGIGAGVGCDGQVLVLPDLLGLNEGFSPRFLKRYANLADTVRDAVREYAEDVTQHRYPGEEHSF